MQFVIGKRYIIVFDINSRVITFTCTVTKEDENFVHFTDKYNTPLVYNKKYIVSSEELQ